MFSTGNVTAICLKHVYPYAAKKWNPPRQELTADNQAACSIQLPTLSALLWVFWNPSVQMQEARSNKKGLQVWGAGGRKVGTRSGIWMGVPREQLRNACCWEDFSFQTWDCHCSLQVRFPFLPEEHFYPSHCAAKSPETDKGDKAYQWGLIKQKEMSSVQFSVLPLSNPVVLGMSLYTPSPRPQIPHQ